MEKKVNKTEKKQIADISEKKISRKEAIKKTGYMAVSTATMMVLLNNKAKAHGNGNGGCQTSGGASSGGEASSS